MNTGFSNTNIYFETSALNYFANKYNGYDAIATKGLQKTKGNLYYLSPVTIWEVLLTKEAEKREKIIYYSQNLFHDKLMKSPSEIIVDYISSGCPLNVSSYDIHSKLEVSKIWANLVSDTKQTFVYDYDLFKQKMSFFHKLSKQIEKIINRVVLDITYKDDEFAIQQFINSYYLDIRDNLKHTDPNYHKTIKLSILFLFYFMCLEMEIDNSPIVEFWKKVKVSDPIQRLNYLMTFYEGIILRGPIYQMAIMAFHQTSENIKGNRGLIMDCMHSLYLVLSDFVITNDKHFSTLRDRKLHPNYRNVLHISEISITTKLRDVYTE